VRVRGEGLVVDRHGRVEGVSIVEVVEDRSARLRIEIVGERCIELVPGEIIRRHSDHQSFC
jgi:hypothetical protein